MKQTQGVFFTGYVTIKAIGHHPELFFDLCAREGVAVWNIRKVSETECQGNIKLSDVSQVKNIRRKTIYKVSFIHKKGIPFLSRRFLIKKPLIIGLLLSIVFVLFLSNVVWDVKVKGLDDPEIEQRIITQLNEYGVHPGAMKFNIAPPAKIQQRLLDDIPELLWVGVTEKGTTYHLEGVKKTTVEEKEKQAPRHLVASKAGVIADMFVSKGQPMVKVNDLVKKGDILVSGELGENSDNNKEEDDEENENEEASSYVAAEGEVIAKTWYESNVTIPLQASYEVLTGENKHKYFLKFGDFKVPVWGFFDPEYKQSQIETNEKRLQFFKWKLPIAFVDENVQELEFVKEERTKEQAIERAIVQAKTNLQEQLGKKAEISFEKVLHESIDNGKVKLKLYFTVYENIAKIQPLSQGD